MSQPVVETAQNGTVSSAKEWNARDDYTASGFIDSSSKQPSANHAHQHDVDTLPTPSAQDPQDCSPDTLTPQSTRFKPFSVLKLPGGSGLKPLRSKADETVQNADAHSESIPQETEVNSATTNPGGRKSVQFSRETQDIEPNDIVRDTSLTVGADKADATKAQSLYSKLRALATSQTLTHTRSPSGTSLSGKTVDAKDLNGAVSAGSPRHEGGLAATIEEDDSDADADAEESAAESAPEGASDSHLPRKRRRKPQRFGNVETAPSSPHSIIRAPYASQDRPAMPPRRATDTDMANGRQGLSEDEGRKKFGQPNGWTPRHPLRGLSYGGQRKPNEPSVDKVEARRPLTLLNFANIASAREIGDVETPKTSRRRLMAERGATLSAARWRQIKNSFRLLGRKREMTQDHAKSAELLAELAAGSPAALMLASMFQRDEHNNRRIPVLLEQLKVRVTDSEVDRSREPDNTTPGDKHLVFRIELEYGNGINRMRWVVKRSLRDFANLHIKYKLHYGSEKLKGRGGDGKVMPKFPKGAFPYLKAFRGLDDEEEDEEEALNENDGTATDTDQAGPRARRRPSFGGSRRKSSTGNAQEAPNTPGAAARRDARFTERQKKQLEIYLQKMIKFMLFRADSNRLCKFLEVSALGMRLAAEGSYHGKEGFLLIRSAKGIDFRKALTPSNFSNRHSPKWFLVRHSYVVCVDSPEEMHIYDVFLFDSDFHIQSSKGRLKDQTRAKDLAEAARESAKHPQHHRLKLTNSERRIKLLARNERQLHQFEESIRLMTETSPWSKVNRFGSFAPVRPNCFAQWLVDGRDYMWVVSRALSQAKDVIYIHDWWLSPELYMRRPPAISQKWRLDRLLKRKAEEGVKVFVIVYRNIESAIPIDSQYTKFSLLDLHPNVFVQRSPNQFRQNTFFWAHHEKVCIVDHTLAFVGGIDLCFGRWDTPQHTLIDDKPTGFEPSDGPKDADHCQLWPGKDYSNPRIQDFYSLNKPYEEMYDRQRIARMPWHDISMQVVGQPARDLTRHFVQRWNYILRQRKPTRPTPFLLPPPDFNAGDLEALGLDGTCEVQILRSAGPWSIGTPDKTEHSIMNAYVKLIEESEHFVYIENQFYISSCETEGAVIHNKINDALVERITRASNNEESWRACVIIPLIPGFQNTVEQEGGTSVRLIMQYQYRSICRGESSLFGRLRSRGIEPEDYIQFYSLRQWGRIGPNNALVTEQLYIHAKCMIVDDRVSIIGSANINERSMLGNRDSECAAVVRDTDMLWSRMNGEPYRVGRFPHSLRMRLMREHLGLDVDKIMEDAQAMEAERSRADGIGKSAASRPNSPDSPFTSPISDFADTPISLEVSKQEMVDDVLKRAEEQYSFNHDVDWEQKENPNLKSSRKLTEDPRVTGNQTHRQDVDGQGFDKMTEITGAGHGIGRDTTVLKGGKEVLMANLDTEGKKSVQSPLKHGQSMRLPSYVVRQEMPEPPLPPRPSFPRLNTEELGLPMVSQLPPLPTLDDTDIGGPPTETTRRDSRHNHHPLITELRRPILDRDCMTDPIHDSFIDDIWNTIAENNTKIYRTVFRCMPDSQVRDWNEYHQYIAYEERFNQLQGLEVSVEAKVTNPNRTNSKSGPPGTGTKAPIAQLKAIAKVPTDVEVKKDELKDKSKQIVGGNTKIDKDQTEKSALRDWAAQANRAQVERQESFTSHDVKLNEKTSLTAVPEGAQVVIEGSEEEGTETSHSPHLGDKNEKGSEKHSPSIPAASSDAANTNTVSTTQSRRRRRATTRSSRRDFSATDDILNVEEAEELLECVQGSLVLWPYEW